MNKESENKLIDHIAEVAEEHYQQLEPFLHVKAIKSQLKLAYMNGKQDVLKELEPNNENKIN